jgi:two-component system OmpR family response regulator
LIVEDDDGVRDMLVRAVGAAGYEVASAATGRHALHQGLRLHFDAVLLDWMLPDMRGDELIRRLNGHGVEPGLVVMTGYVGELSPHALRELGVSNLLIKPVEIAVILETLEEVIGGESGDVEGNAVAEEAPPAEELTAPDEGAPRTPRGPGQE